MDMRGLSVFISDIRKSTTKEEEQSKVEKELAKIRGKFKNGASLKGYDRKKYICKLLYIYMLGYEIEFGHIEAVNLLASPNYSEKHMGYLACSLLLNENHEMVTLITQCMKNDLNSKNPNDQCLALTAIANIGGKEQAEALAHDVQKLLISNETKLTVRKKAALTLLNLYRKYPESLPPDTWSEKVIALINGRDLGVITSVMSLILGLAEKNPEAYHDAVSKTARLLMKLVLNREYSTSYLYYKIAAPWLQVKAFQLLQYYPAPEDKAIYDSIIQAIEKVVQIAKKSKETASKSVSQINAAHSVLFEALNVAIHYDSAKTILVTSCGMLTKYLKDRETNLRYLALDTLSRMAYSQFDEVLATIRKEQDTILLALKDPDISIRRRALDLLYSMCNRDNAGEIVGELLNYLPLSDYAIREELVLKIAILAEKFSVDLTWYVDVVLNLISQAGDFVADDIWHRVIQIVTNKGEELQKYTAQTVFSAVSSPAAHETCVKVSGYIFGEFGDLIDENPQTDSNAQYELLLSKFNLCSTVTKCHLFNAFMKLYNLYPDNQTLRDQIKDVFEKHTNSFDAELQQRAAEYLALINTGDENLIQAVMENMPMYPERDSQVIKRLMEKEAAKKRGAGSGQKGENGEEEEEEEIQETKPVPTKQSDDLLDMLDMGGSTTTGNTGYDMNDILSGFGTGNVSQPPQQTHSIDDILGGFGPTSTTTQPPVSTGGDLFGGVNIAAQAANLGKQKKEQRDQTGFNFDDVVMANKDNALEQNEQVHQDAAVKHQQLLKSAEGVAIEDEHLQVKIKTEYHGCKGRIILLYGNKTTNPLTQFRVHILVPKELEAQISKPPPMISPKTQVQQYVDIVAKAPFSELTDLDLYFEANRRYYRFNIKLPIVPHKFMEPYTIADADSFFRQWHQIPKDTPQEQQKIFPCTPRYSDSTSCAKVLSEGFNFAILQGIDNPSNVVAAASFFYDPVGKVNVLLRLEYNAQRQAFRLTVKAADTTIANQVFQYVLQELTSQ
ncbi:hypothetical protein C9374_000717 [Naegleria lovaniensis]|uniref:AP-2 complex subunit alpha n=1 Tax=Naegleria lovaniensis TaxID=51637 RepID=A0AA88KNH2_NAELO|nr:uncharacterized protein C9374_000717 [Naegleria lovaniensis]KAG2388553.1 hypothetical protein C9374_000717 [Naegleria lovaniensis]